MIGLPILLLTLALTCYGYDIRGTYSWSPKATYEALEGEPLTVRCYFSDSDPDLIIYTFLLKEQHSSSGLFSTTGSPFGQPRMTRNGNRGKIFWSTEDVPLEGSGNYSCIISQYPKDTDPDVDTHTQAVTMTFADFEVKVHPKSDHAENQDKPNTDATDSDKFEVEVRETPVVGHKGDPLFIECFFRGAHTSAVITSEVKREPEEGATEDMGPMAPVFTSSKYSAVIDGTGKVTLGAMDINEKDTGTYSCTLLQEYTNPETGEKETESASTKFSVIIKDTESEEYLENDEADESDEENIEAYDVRIDHEEGLDIHNPTRNKKRKRRAVLKNTMNQSN